MQEEHKVNLSINDIKNKLIIVSIALFVFIVVINALFFLSKYYLDNGFKTETEFLDAKEIIDTIEYDLKQAKDIKTFSFDKYIKNDSDSIWVIGSINSSEPIIYYSSRHPNLESKDISNKESIITKNDYIQTINENEIYRFYDISKYVKKIVHFKKINENLIIGFEVVSILENDLAKNHDFRYWIVHNMKTNILLGIGMIILSAIIMFMFYKFYSNFISKIQNEINEKNKELYNQNIELQQRLYIDPLTGLLNQVAINRDLKDMDMPKIIVLDIDNFRTMNDYFGKDICDQLLIELGSVLQKFAKENNLIAYRLIGDQFVLLENSLFDIEKYEDIAKELVSKFKGRIFNVTSPKNTLDYSIELHVTMGLSLEPENTLAKAFTALKMAKSLNKDYVCYFKEIDQIKKFKSNISKSYMINKAIYNNEVIPYFQPIFDKDKNVIKYESLIRIVNDIEGTISPAVFLEVSKKTKRYSEIETILIDKTFQTIKNNPNAVISVNVSKTDMLDGNVSSFIIEKLSEYNIGNRVVFEILEEENIESAENISRIENFIKRIKRMGAKIAIDDFGSGYSNFAYLLKLLPDYLKIDGSIIRDIDKDRNSYIMTRAIVAFAKDLNIKTIAEFVSSKEVFDICVELGIDEFQGYYLGEPKKELLS